MSGRPSTNTSICMLVFTFMLVVTTLGSSSRATAQCRDIVYRGDNWSAEQIFRKINDRISNDSNLRNFLGCPVADYKHVSSQGIGYVEFENGLLMSSNGQDTAYVMYGAIHRYFQTEIFFSTFSFGFQQSREGPSKSGNGVVDVLERYGPLIADETDFLSRFVDRAPLGRVSRFEKGAIFWSPVFDKTDTTGIPGVRTVTDTMYRFVYIENKGGAGFPLTQEEPATRCYPNEDRQQFFGTPGIDTPTSNGYTIVCLDTRTGKALFDE